MATRFYLPSTGTPGQTPNYDAGWEQVTAADRRNMHTAKIASSMTDKADAETSNNSAYDVLLRQYISTKTYEAFSFLTSQTWKLQVRAVESGSAADMFVAIIAKVISGDGGTVRGTIVNFLVDTTEITHVTLTNRSMSGNISNNVSMQSGDRILLEIGFRATNSKTTSYTGTLNFGDDSGTDLPENDSETTAYNPWFELSPTLSPIITYKTLAGTVDAVSGVPDIPFIHRTKKIAGVSVDGISGASSPMFKRIRRFTDYGWL